MRVMSARFTLLKGLKRPVRMVQQTTMQSPASTYEHSTSESYLLYSVTASPVMAFPPEVTRLIETSEMIGDAFRTAIDYFLAISVEKLDIPSRFRSVLNLKARE